jgi:D-serine deaminase-like pyridoxal phosphate-dependent protein
MQRAPARAGDPLSAVETPALCVDLPAFERNLERMAGATRDIRLRPHAKSHKCPAIAQRQVALGAVGICCQKTDEAATFVAAGIRDVLLTNEVVAAPKLARLAELARAATIGVLFDSPEAVRRAGTAATATGVTLDAYVEVDVGAHRCGVAPGAATLELAQSIARTPGLCLRGLHAYQGRAQHLRTPPERASAIAAAVDRVASTRRLLRESGLPCDIVTGAGTGTWPLERDSGAYDELQPGSYIFMDADYGRNEPAQDDVAFEQSLFVRAAVMSVPSRERAIVDAGLKAFAFDSGPPLVHGAVGLEYAKASDEHGVLAVDPSRASPRIGDALWLVPGHCDPTVNLYDWIVAYRGERVEELWPVAARGALG